MAFIDRSIRVMKTWGALLLICLLLFISGCQEQSIHTEPHDTHTVEIDLIRTTATDESQQSAKPAVITLVDPRTLETVQTIMPKELGYEADEALYETELKKMAKDLARGTETSTGYDQTMELDRLAENGQIIKGNPGVILKESELVDSIMKASENGGEVHLPLYEMASHYQEEEISTLSEVALASYTTYFQASEQGRSKNIELSAHALNNIIVGVGDYFSFNTMVGERTEEKGYQSAYEIVNKQLVLGIGGGICQTSSTLFNAVDQMAVRITERHHHSLSIGYVPAGRDATVSYGTLDFKFQNTSGVPYLIKTFYESGALTIEIRTASHYKVMLENA